MYDEINQIIVRVLKVLTSTDTTFVALVDEEELKKILNKPKYTHIVYEK